MRSSMRQNLFIVSMILLLIIIGGGMQFLRRPTADTPVWNGIVPSQTTREEVIALLGEPDKRWLCVWPNHGIDPIRHRKECELTAGVVNYGYYHEQLPEGPYGFHHIQFNKNGRVDYIVETKWSALDEAPLTVSELFADYGKPERATWSLRNTARNAILYCRQGLIMHATSVEDQTIIISEIVYFAPISTEQCVNKFFNEITIINPYKSSDLVISEDPWGFNDKMP